MGYGCFGGQDGAGVFEVAHLADAAGVAFLAGVVGGEEGVDDGEEFFHAVHAGADG